MAEPRRPAMLSLDEALQRLLAVAGDHAITDVEKRDTWDALGRVLARPVVSALDVPPADNSSMDGYALRAADVPAPGTLLAVSQRIPAGVVGAALQPGTAARIFTGAQVPAGADAVVMQEDCSLSGDFVSIDKKPKENEWIRFKGSDIRKGGMVLAAGKRLLPQDTGLAASVGIKTLPVFRKLRLGLFFTGDELVMPGDPLLPGRIYNSNRFTLNGLAAAFGCEVRDYGIVPDNLDKTREVLRRAAVRTTPSSPRAGCRWATRTTSGRPWKRRARC